ncbi:type VI secretion system baseplate subunit TssG [Achromobacter arsenitoxydans]|uniref:type VI secretion system baseplate subunit TssG n=1 Tax=Achromobacter arsenitoxydans TaxID=1147684 RepID=UPI0009D922D2|nr:type VI secretion system baseplate subunit TssG [Achromobacter arsenitoxydans]
MPSRSTWGDAVDAVEPVADPQVRNAAESSDAYARWWRALEREPYGHDLFHALRWMDAHSGARKPLGRDTVARHEPVRLRQEPSLAFAPSTVARAQAARGGRPAQLSIYGFGLFGPNGPLPLHLTEFAHERMAHYGDRTLAAFADIFHHRLILLFYRAWADAQSTVSLDRKEASFSRYIASLLHMGEPSMRRRDAVLDHAKYYMAGHLVRQTRNPEGLKHILQSFFGLPVNICEFVPQWIRLDPDQRLGLGNAAGLGRDTVLGVAVRDAQHKFRIEIGPLTQEDYASFLPGGTRARQLTHWVRQYIGVELAWELRPVLSAEHACGLKLGASSPLGLSAWLGQRRPSQGDARDLLLDYERRERTPARGRVPAQPSGTSHA